MNQSFCFPFNTLCYKQPLEKLGKFILGSTNHLHPVSQLVKGWVYVSFSTGKSPKKLRVGGGEVQRMMVRGQVQAKRMERFRSSEERGAEVTETENTGLYSLCVLRTPLTILRCDSMNPCLQCLEKPTRYRELTLKDEGPS